MDGPGLDQLLEALDVHLEAFAVCEIGRNHSLRCSPSDAVVVHFVLKGEGFLTCEYGRYALQPGTVVVVPPHLLKELSGSGDTEVVVGADKGCSLEDGLVIFRAVCGDADLLLGCAVLSAKVGDTVEMFDHLREPIFEQSGDPVLAALLSAMLHELRAPGVGTRSFVSAVMKQIIILLARSKQSAPNHLLPAFLEPRLGGAVAAVMHRPHDPHTIESMASKAGMSRSRFCHHFASAYRCTPRAFVQSVRLASAAKMLWASELPVKSIAASVGYASRSHFSKAFNAKYGRDPSSYRRERGCGQ